MEYEAVIGLEVHAQLSTKNKLFCPANAKPKNSVSVSDLLPNSQVSPVSAGHPGTLPVLNRAVIERAVKAGLATGCSIQNRSVFSRKHYFYPDLPKGYQISQYDLPLCLNGFIEIELKSGERKKIRIHRIHVEEDAGKTVHHDGYSIVNLNRAGVPLIEIVSEADLRTSEEAVAYLKALHAILTTIDVCDGNLQEGNFRCDANVSIRPVGQIEFGTRTEIKNINSFRFVEKAIDYEISRQKDVLEAGEKIDKETRLYDSAKNKTFSMRTKEDAEDYRYFPDPDLLPLVLEESWIQSIAKNLPELPHQRKERFCAEYGLSRYDAGVLAYSSGMGEFFDLVLSEFKAEKNSDLSKLAKKVSNLLTGEVLRWLGEKDLEIKDTKLKPKNLFDLVGFLERGELSSTASKTVLLHLLENTSQVSEVVDRLGLKQVNDTEFLQKVIQGVIHENPAQVAEFQGGKEKLLGFFVGLVMKKSQGKANPALAQEMVLKALKKD